MRQQIAIRLQNVKLSAELFVVDCQQHRNKQIDQNAHNRLQLMHILNLKKSTFIQLSKKPCTSVTGTVINVEIMILILLILLPVFII